MYLIPYRKDCTPIIGYKGMLELIRRTGEVKRINAQVFYRQEIESGAVRICLEPPMLEHDWMGEEFGDDDLAGSYCVVEGSNGEKYMSVCTRNEIIARRSRSAAGNKGPWKSDFAAMARKCAVRKLFGGGTVPVSAEKMKLINVAMEQDGDSNGAPRPTRVQKRMQSFTVPATGKKIEAEVIDVEAEADEPIVESSYSEAMKIAKNMGASNKEITEAIGVAGYEGVPIGQWTDVTVTEVINTLEQVLGAPWADAKP
jgi:recombinational DNA repair protein RecT